MRLFPCLACSCVLLGSLAAQQEVPQPFQVAPQALSASGADTATEAAHLDKLAPENGPSETHAGENTGSGGGAAPVPEPGALFLVGTGLLGVALTARLRRRDRRPQ
ncbi:MAG: PEP-CTERM sorting domain-containing protein [Planctomycetes bacterium]|nr:PEP-CTERM sorting domain-containing protein [Planctomycetota bacterium]